MKIVMLQDFFVGGLAYQENLLAKYYVKLGHEVVFITSTFTTVFDYVKDKYDSSVKKSIEYVDGAKIIRLPYSLNILNKLRKHGGTFKIFEAEKPDLIYAHDIHLNLTEAVRYKKLNPKCRIIMDYHADLSNSANGWISLNILHKIIRKKFLHRYLKHIDRIFPIVPASMDFLSEVYDIERNRMEILPLGCDRDLSLEILKRNNQASVRQKYGIAENDFVVITGGKLVPAKKTDILIHSIKNISDSNIHLVIYGKAMADEYDRHLKQLASSIKVTFTGWLNNQDVMEVMSCANLAVYPASQSVVWQQSVGMHLPMIVGDVGSQNAEYLNLKDNLIVLSKKDITVDKLTEQIVRLKSQPNVLEAMKQGAIWVAENYLDYRIICNKTLER